MSSQLINGKEISNTIRTGIQKEVQDLIAKGITPGLAVILVGEDPASHTYVANKEKACKELGIYSKLIKLPEDTTEEDLLTQIKQLNEASEIDGILVQLPLPKQINEQKVIETISPLKDVDGFHPNSVGKMLLGQETFLPCTPHGIMKLLEYSNIEVAGKHAVVIGRSHIVGVPMGQLLLQHDATVTYCHSKTKNLQEMTKQADILVVAIGRAKMITADYIKEGAAVIDVGMNRDENNHLCGDVDFDSVVEKTSAITPVPGGVGPMTITMLMYNTVQSAKTKLA
ncbi:bifunctional methylenetetrahydrofolate dehydrogenase/methenyltetrahydrofolate cyclohydrolase FolD [Kurthia gibsonii]|uniref:bifunctional methylenetetrahydrofolate dehydrogenase/methenyltetrahydrofolate cyclohydrolase FolD n=1 Tax=Kurthia TaxID=1649 RepID=UPI000745C7DE|nr:MULTISPECIES: bifunctional methylenetetrahydrofolate dehydrogenase/methenyltetrahydrofolate cyclohydrolase FolD [Kurthia]AMA62980.1 tetrahydrofolate dehydrogenase/cyclohydrolase, catalytic domain protein [Kurthia sp. 11kri321]RXH53304.1 bifunctional methylenetetrahydrofolate dehydrogenase/methenyltetrahydrofolate cyclohydrolase FolD [Kurthia gibsonii]